VSEQVRTVAAGSTSFLLREQPSDAGGTPVLLLHGVPETASCWSALAPRLAEGRRVLAPDLPGLGGSTYTGPYDVASLVGELAALVEAEVPGGRVDVVGHDWGGSLALGLAGARPDLVRRLVVANAPYRSVPARALHIPFFALPGAPELLFRVAGRQVVDAAFAIAWRADTPLSADALAEYRAAYTRPSVVQAMLGYYRAAARPRLARLVSRSTPPVPVPRVRAERALVLWGAKDPVLPVSTGEAVVRDLGADCVMVTVPSAGHFVVEEAPQIVGDVLVDFLADAPVATPAAPPEKPDATPMEPPPAVLEAPPLKAPAKKAPAKRKAPSKRIPPSA
jgi:pimeloyl-ACP methyl ester carboxylesterase